MRVTVDLAKNTVNRLRREAKRTGRTMSELAEIALRLMFASERTAPKKVPTLPRFSMGRHRVDISDRDALYDALDDLSLYKQN